MIESSIEYMESELEVGSAEEPVTCLHQQDKVIVKFRDVSHLCSQHAQEIHQSLKKQIDGTKDVVIDLDGIVSVDAQGLAVLIYFHKKLTSQNQSISLANPSSSIRKLLRITEIDRLIETESEFDEDLSSPDLAHSLVEVYDPVPLSAEKKYK